MAPIQTRSKKARDGELNHLRDLLGRRQALTQTGDCSTPLGQAIAGQEKHSGCASDRCQLARIGRHKDGENSSSRRQGSVANGGKTVTWQQTSPPAETTAKTTDARAPQRTDNAFRSRALAPISVGVSSISFCLLEVTGANTFHK